MPTFLGNKFIALWICLKIKLGPEHDIIKNIFLDNGNPEDVIALQHVLWKVLLISQLEKRLVLTNVLYI